MPFLFCVLLAVTVSAQTPSTPPVANATTETRWSQEIPDLMQKAGIPALSIAVIRHGKTAWTASYGVRSKVTKAPVSNETMFNVGSLSKPVFAYGVLKLVDAGKLKLDEPLAPYLPKEMTEGDPRFKQITARLVLSHRTGFPNWPPDGKPLVIYFTPGERFSYSGAGIVFLQIAVEKITGKPLNNYLQEAVFTPLGMKHSSYIWNPVFENQTAAGHTFAGTQADLFKPDHANAAASLSTTVEDYALFLNAVLNKKGLKAETLRDMEKPQIAVDIGCENCVEGSPTGKLSTKVFWGLGFGIEQTADGESLWHWGDNGVYKAFFVIRPARKSGVVYMTNSENGLAIARPILSLTLGGDQPALDWLKYDNYDSPSFAFTRMALQQGASPALSEFSAELSGDRISEGALNQLGYSFLGANKIADAILVFRKNVELHPDSWNVYDSLGEAYAKNGERDLAIQNYQKSIQLNASNANGVAALKKLESQ